MATSEAMKKKTDFREEVNRMLDEAAKVLKTGKQFTPESVAAMYTLGLEAQQQREAKPSKKDEMKAVVRKIDESTTTAYKIENTAARDAIALGESLELTMAGKSKLDFRKWVKEGGRA